MQTDCATAMCCIYAHGRFPIHHNWIFCLML